MDFRHLGNSGLKISTITYGHWLTHGSQVENEQATACVRAALEAGITTFDTADVYANTKAETVLGDALHVVWSSWIQHTSYVRDWSAPVCPTDLGFHDVLAGQP